MSNLTIPTKCLHRLLRNETQHCYDHETTQRRFDAAFDWANDVYPRKKICGLAWIIASEIERSLIGDVNSTFLTVADLRRKHDNDTVMRFFVYACCYPLNNQLALQCLRFGVDKKGGFVWGGLEHHTPLVMSNHAIERLFTRFHAVEARASIEEFMFLVKIIMINASSFYSATQGFDKSGSKIDKIPVSRGYFPLVYEADRIILATYIDDGLYRPDQEDLIETSRLSEGVTGGFLTHMESAYQQRIPITLSEKEYLVRRVNSYYPTHCGLLREDFIRPKPSRKIDSGGSNDRIK